MNAPDIKHNPHPTMRYEITLTIKDAPGPFDSISGFMQYDVANEQCSPFDKFVGIHRKPPGQTPPIVFGRTSDDVYTGTLYLDLLQDEDYYGLGVCHWGMNYAVVALKIGESTFSPDISQEHIVSGIPMVMYFPKRAYGNNAIKDMLYDGVIEGTPGAAYMDIHRNEFFSVTLSAKERFE